MERSALRRSIVIGASLVAIVVIGLVLSGLLSGKHDLRLRPARGAVFNLRITTKAEVSIGEGDDKVYTGHEATIGYE